MSTAEERMQDAIDELEQENRLLRARNDRLEAEAKVVSVQEPVAWAWRISPNADHWQFSEEPHLEATQKRPLVFGDTPSPSAQRQWIGLTDEQKLSLEIQGGKSDVILAELVEGWLKEKNS